MSTSEKVLERKLREATKRLGGIAVKIGSPSFTGLPDRLVLLPGGRIWFVEMKSTGKKPSPRQLVVHALLRRLGFTVWVIDSETLLNDFLNAVQAA